MRISLLSPPGRLPTVVYDPGAWWSHLAALGSEPERMDLNAAWWRVVCGGAGADVMQAAPRHLWQRPFRGDAGAAAVSAGRSLGALQEPAAYATAARFVESVTPLARHLAALNRSQGDLLFHADFGVRVMGLDYGDSRALVEYAQQETPLSALIAAAIDRTERPLDVLIATVSRPEELLSALIAVRLLKVRQPRLHACLADHSHENFTLATHLHRLRGRGTLESIFDTIIESKDDRDSLVPKVVADVAAGHAPRGYLSRSAQAMPLRTEPWTLPPPGETFCSEPILWTRISPRRCYWDRCNFCALNAKFADPRSPSLDSIPVALDRLEAATRGGYRIVNFGDEALSPAMLESLSRGILERGIEVRWACCCKLETAYTPALFALMRAAGCYEVFWGLESISPRVLRLMGKEVPGLDRDSIGRILRRANEAGLGLHVSLMAGFPGDTPGEAAESVEFVIEALRGLSNATFNLNRFMLLDGSPIMADPGRFGVTPEPATGDMPFRHAYRLVAGLADDADRIDQLLPSLQRRLHDGLGWDRFGDGPGAALARDLHFFFGHGSIFKQSGDHAFVNPLLHRAAAA